MYRNGLSGSGKAGSERILEEFGLGQIKGKRLKQPYEFRKSGAKPVIGKRTGSIINNKTTAGSVVLFL